MEWVALFQKVCVTVTSATSRMMDAASEMERGGSTLRPDSWIVKSGTVFGILSFTCGTVASALPGEGPRK